MQKSNEHTEAGSIKPSMTMDKLLLIWDMPDKVFTKVVLPTKKEAVIKYLGKKPNRIVVPSMANTDKINKVVKSAIAHNGLAVCTDGTVIYDGRNANAVNRAGL